MCVFFNKVKCFEVQSYKKNIEFFPILYNFSYIQNNRLT